MIFPVFYGHLSSLLIKSLWWTKENECDSAEFGEWQYMG